jgi:muconolactone D-isomerase
MLFQVEMDVHIPHGLDAAYVEALKATERERAQELQRSGKWRHLWRVAGQYRNVSIFDVESNAELHDILTSLPLFSFMVVRVTALCRHPSSVHDDDR